MSRDRNSRKIQNVGRINCTESVFELLDGNGLSRVAVAESSEDLRACTISLFV